MQTSNQAGNAQFEALLAATLVLMTHYAETASPGIAARIGDNLLHLSGIGALPWELRTVLAKLTARWSLLHEVAAAAPRGNARPH